MDVGFVWMHGCMYMYVCMYICMNVYMMTALVGCTRCESWTEYCAFLVSGCGDRHPFCWLFSVLVSLHRSWMASWFGLAWLACLVYPLIICTYVCMYVHCAVWCLDIYILAVRYIVIASKDAL